MDLNETIHLHELSGRTGETYCVDLCYLMDRAVAVGIMGENPMDWTYIQIQETL